jgi:hypothetical protein
VTIPEVRERLTALAAELGLPELEWLAAELRRRPSIRRAPIKNHGLAPAQKAAIRRELRDNPDAHLQEVADRYGVNIGRVSEVLRGKRT